MPRLFKRKSKKATKEFKFETSLKLKDLSIEEYAHVAYAFQTAILRFERMLKESLLEGYITSTTLEKISQEFHLAIVRDLEVPTTPSLEKIFGIAPPAKLAKQPISADELPTPSVEVVETPSLRPIIHKTPSTTPQPSTPPITEPSPDAKPSPPTIPSEQSITRPKISFSFPEKPDEPKEIPSAPSPTPAPIESPKSEITPPTIPKISFPSISKPSSIPSPSPLSQPKGQREEDRATGIAILRKQMLTELKKIRSVVSEQER